MAEVTVSTHTTVVEKKILVPLIHLNGTSKDALLHQLEDAWRTLDAAVQALIDAAPHPRDYYPLGQNDWTRAEAEHRSRMERLTSVKSEIDAIRDALLFDVLSS